MNRQSKNKGESVGYTKIFTPEEVNSLLSGTEELLNTLRNRLALPRVEPDGSSECAFAENMYAEKEECEAKVNGRLNTLRDCLVSLDGGIQRCRHNLSTISGGATKMHIAEAARGYANAYNAQGMQHQKAVELRKRVWAMIQKVEAALQKSRGKQYPGKKPEKSFRPPMPMPVSASSFPETSRICPSSGEMDSLKRELGSLLSLSPLPKLGAAYFPKDITGWKQ